MSSARLLPRLLAASALVALGFAGCGGSDDGGPPSGVAGSGGSGADSGNGTCGDGTCDVTESCKSCPEDCNACTAAGCGNGMCEQNESCKTCADDCGSCTCGNGTCDDDESCSDCQTDCGACAATCGDGSCDQGDNEDCDSCPADCGSCPTVCGDGLCNSSSEDCTSCSADCGACQPSCGDGSCAGSEDCDGCPADCGTCVCGNTTCDDDEDCDSCPGDCGPCVCGDTHCDPNEDCSTCATDCGSCTGSTCGDGKCTLSESCATCIEDCGPCTNYDPGKLVVYTINYENLPIKSPKECEGTSPDPALCAECQGEWQELLDTIAAKHVAPDVMLIQQINGKGVPRGIEKVTAKLGELFPGETYKSIVAEKTPEAWSGANCVAKRYQTNGIIFRAKRLLYVKDTKKTLMAKKTTAGGCVDGKLSRNLGVFGKFADLMHGKNGSGGYKREIAIASIHWPVEDGCGVTNANLTDDLLLTYTGAQMYLWGGDVNLQDSTDNIAPMPWYRRANAELKDPANRGYRDPIWRACGGQFGSCIAQSFTFNEKRRLDYLFVKYAPKYKSVLPMTSDEATIDGDPNASGLHYSQHESVSAYVYW